MNTLILEKERADLVTRMVEAHEDSREDDYKELKNKVVKINDRISEQQFVDEQSLRSAPKPDVDETKHSERIAKEYDLPKALLQAYDGQQLDGLEGEVQTELRSKPHNKKHSARAVLIPDELWERRAVTAGTAGAQVATESYRPQEFLPALRDRSISSSLGARMIQGTGNKIKIPRQDAATTATWMSETGAVANTDMTFQAPLELEAKRLAYRTSHSDELLRESGGGLAIQRIILEEGARAMALELDKRIFYTASTAPTSGPSPMLKVGSNGGEITAHTQSGTSTNGKLPTYGDILSLVSASQDANMPMMRPGFAINYKTMRKYKETRRLTGSTDDVTIYSNGMLDGYPTQVSNIIPSDLSKGSGSNLSALVYSSDWQYLVIASWGSTSLIVDPYSLAEQATTRLVWAQYLDFKILRPSAFAWYADVLTT